MIPSSLLLTLPDWMESFLNRFTFPMNKVEDRMRFVIAMSHENIMRTRGGPFAAAIFNADTGDLLSCGVNRVVPLNCSMAHAEMMAIGFAQQRFSTFDLGGPGLPDMELITSTEPCAMCLGAIPWSGIRKIVCGATDADAREVGFDEGTKAPNWIDGLMLRGISVTTAVCRQEAKQVFALYSKTNGIIYNGRNRAIVK